MLRKNNKKIAKEDESSKVRLYKTHQGWVSSLSRYMRLLLLDKDRQVTTDEVQADPDALSKRMTTQLAPT